MRRLIAAAVLGCTLLVPAGAPAAAPQQTATGIPLDAPWKATVYTFAQATFKHPAWGWQHSERDYRLAVEVAQGDRLTVDTDVLFAAAFLHDMAAFAPYEKKGMEHGDRAAETSEAVLRDAGFPMRKYPAVQAAERGHMYYSNAGTMPEAIALHDADSLDFLGTMGAVRILALTGEDKPDATRAIKTLRGFVKDIPPRLITATAKRMGAERAAELTRLLDQVQTESYGGAAT
ncbi:MAG TPA: HD domain-containing protein [Candidatus Elarobacter sp.]|nr:HD domain-containing protein [Candidatus Elarobacter sp.]HEV2738072.1 HD domain-containing protein [Candidatus Elarobacter sp.]